MKKFAVALLLAASCGAGFSVARADEAAPAPKPAPTTLAPADVMAEPVIEKSPEYQERRAIWKNVAELLKNGTYDQLEELALRYRQSKAAWFFGQSHLRAFYEGLDSPPDVAFSEHIGRIEKWIKAKPQSVVAQIVLARAYNSGAFKARGTGWASDVTADGATLMEERHQKAHRALAAVSAKRKGYPEWYDTASDLSLLGEPSGKRYDELMDEGARLFPDHHDIQFNRVYHLLPRWYGESGDWERYAAREADRRGGTEGDILYTQIIWSFDNTGLFMTVLKEAHLSWPREKRGWQALLKRYPDNLNVATMYAFEAYRVNELETARTLFKTIIKNRVAAEVWKNKDAFIEFRYLTFSPLGKAAKK